MTTDSATEELARAFLNGDWSILGESLRILTVHGKIWHANKVNDAISLAYQRLAAEAPAVPVYSWHYGTHPIQAMVIQLEQKRSAEAGHSHLTS